MRPLVMLYAGIELTLYGFWPEDWLIQNACSIAIKNRVGYAEA